MASSVMPGTAAELNLPVRARASFTNSATVLIFIEAGTPTPRMVTGEARHRNEVVRIVGELLVLERMHREVAARSPQKGVVVIGGQHGLDCDDAVAARAVIDHDRLAPLLLQPFLDQPRADVGAGAGAERDDPAHRPVRPVSAPAPAQVRRAGPNFRARRRRRPIPATNACVSSGCICPASEQGLATAGRTQRSGLRLCGRSMDRRDLLALGLDRGGEFLRRAADAARCRP